MTQWEETWYPNNNNAYFIQYLASKSIMHMSEIFDISSSPAACSNMCYRKYIHIAHMWISTHTHTHTHTQEENSFAYKLSCTYLERSARIDLSICLPPFGPLVSGEGPDGRIHSGDALHPHQNTECTCRHTENRGQRNSDTFTLAVFHFWLSVHFAV